METFKFDTEINQLMHLIINAFYSNQDVFLRELVSNASDALDKVKYLTISDKSLLKGEEEFIIKIYPSKTDNTLTIEDTGIGMTKEELIKNLGTIARSGTKEFIKSLQETKDVNMIGQFGVGFYSAFLVGSRVRVLSKGLHSDETFCWESTADNNFTITHSDEDIHRGTRITIYLNDQSTKYADEKVLKEIIEKHSSYITYPIMLLTEKTREKEVEKIDDEDEVTIDDDHENEEDEKEKPKETETFYEYEKVNKYEPLWTRLPSDVKPEEYSEFYKTFGNSHDEHSYVIHFKAEGSLEFTTLLYVPKTAPYDLFNKGSKKGNVKLYVRKVLITDKCEELIPEYFTFLKGLVDSNDLPLNVSREMLQQNGLMKKMSKHIVKKVIDVLQSSSIEDKEKYKEFYKQYSKNIKLGVYEDSENRDKLVKLLRFYTFNHKDEEISLDQYLSEMKEGQSDIYYITGESMAALDGSPYLGGLVKKGYDVLLLIDPIDEYTMQQVRDFEGKKLVDVTKEGLKVDEDKADDEETFKDLCAFVKEVLGDKVSKVTTSKRET